MAAPHRLPLAPGHAGFMQRHDGWRQVPDPPLQWWCTPPHDLARRTAATYDPGRHPAPTVRRQTHCAFGARHTGLPHPPHRPGPTAGLRARRPLAHAPVPWAHATAVELKNLIALGVIGSKTKIEKLCYRVDTRIAVASLRHACHGSVFSAQRASGPPPAADTDDPGHAACADRPPHHGDVSGVRSGSACGLPAPWWSLCCFFCLVQPCPGPPDIKR